MSSSIENVQGLRICGKTAQLDLLEEWLPAWLEPEDVAGMARQTWRERGYEPPFATEEQPDEGEYLVLYFSDSADARVCIRKVQEGLCREFVDAAPITQFLAEKHVDWAVAWRDGFQPVGISSSLCVIPAWLDAQAALAALGQAGGLYVRIEPGRAFGSGTHATTRLSLRLLESCMKPGTALLDFGAGSGILSLAAAGLGAGMIVAVEIDPEAQENFHLNSELNAHLLDGPHFTGIEYRIGSDECLGKEAFDLVICNALFHRVSGAFPTMLKHLRPEGLFIYSGFLQEEEVKVLPHLAGLGLQQQVLERQEEWSAAVFQKPA